MKFAIFFCFLAFACVTQAQLLPFNISKDFVVQAAKESLEQSREKIDELVERVTAALKSRIDAAKQRTESLIDRLKERVELIKSRIVQSNNVLLQNVNDKVAELAEQAEANGVDVSQCKNLTETLREVADNVVANSTKCLTAKIDAGKAIVEDIVNITENTITELSAIKDAAADCLQNIYSISDIVSAFVCVTKCGGRASWTVAKQVPAVVVNLERITVLMSTLQSSLTQCVSYNAIWALKEEAQQIFEDVKQCVQEKIDEAQANAESESENVEEAEEESAPTEQETTPAESETTPAESEANPAEKGPVVTEEEPATAESTDEANETDAAAEEEPAEDAAAESTDKAEEEAAVAEEENTQAENQEA